MKLKSIDMEIKTLREEIKYQKITVSDIIRSEAFSYGISYIDSVNKGVSVGWDKNNYESFLKVALKKDTGIDAFDQSRGKALFLVLSMDIVEVMLPEDVEKDTHYLGINVKCIRLDINNKLSRNAERIFFTLHHAMSCIDVSNKDVEIVAHLDLPLFWEEQVNENDTIEKSF